jgi:hypothetical protein
MYRVMARTASIEAAPPRGAEDTGLAHQVITRPGVHRICARACLDCALRERSPLCDYIANLQWGL